MVESDIWKLDGDTLFFFNQYRGLQVFNVSVPDSPVVTGTYDLPGSGEQMYVINGTNVVLLARDNCSWYGSGNDSRVVLLQLRDGVPHLVKELPAMSWRRFMVLVSGLSVHSSFVSSLQGQQTIEDPVAAERAVERLWG